MFKVLGLGKSCWGIIALVLLWPGLTVAQDADTQEVERYTLTEAGLAKFKQAMRNLTALPTSADNCEGLDDSASLSDMAAQLDAMPGVKGAIQAAGMTTREYAVFNLSLLHNAMAAWAASQPGAKLPPGTSQANVDFYNRHATEIANLPRPDEGDCDDGMTEDDYDE